MLAPSRGPTRHRQPAKYGWNRHQLLQSFGRKNCSGSRSRHSGDLLLNFGARCTGGGKMMMKGDRKKLSMVCEAHLHNDRDQLAPSPARARCGPCGVLVHIALLAHFEMVHIVHIYLIGPTLVTFVKLEISQQPLMIIPLLPSCRVVWNIKTVDSRSHLFLN